MAAEVPVFISFLCLGSRCLLLPFAQGDISTSSNLVLTSTHFHRRRLALREVRLSPVQGDRGQGSEKHKAHPGLAAPNGCLDGKVRALFSKALPPSRADPGMQQVHYMHIHPDWAPHAPLWNMSCKRTTRNQAHQAKVSATCYAKHIRCGGRRARC